MCYFNKTVNLRLDRHEPNLYRPTYINREDIRKSFCINHQPLDGGGGLLIVITIF